MNDGPRDVDLAAAAQERLEHGSLCFPRCRACGLAWLPPRAECPRCLAANWDWDRACGNARLISWVVYHRAYHESVADRVPYLVALVELSEGPRLISTLLGVAEPRAEMALRLRIEPIDGRAAACFEPPAGGEEQ